MNNYLNPLSFAIQKTWEAMGLLPEKDKTNHYTLYLKSHCEAPDYEGTCEAENKEQAITIFQKRFGEHFDKEIIEKNIQIC